MKISWLPLLTMGCALVLPTPTVLRADDSTTTSTTAPAATAPADGGTRSAMREQRMERFQETMAQLNLTDDQKAKMKQIWESTSPGKDRRQQMMGVLNQDQKDQLKAIWQKRQSAKDDASGN